MKLTPDARAHLDALAATDPARAVPIANRAKATAQRSGEELVTVGRMEEAEEYITLFDAHARAYLDAVEKGDPKRAASIGSAAREIAEADGGLPVTFYHIMDAAGQVLGWDKIGWEGRE